MIKAYLIRGNNEWAFWCSERFQRNISVEIGQPFNNGDRTLITEANLEFRINDKVKISGEELLIDDIQHELKTNKNAMRGAPSYIKTLLVRWWQSI